MRVLNEEGVRVRDLPRLAGVSKEAISMSVGFLDKHGCVSVEADPSASRAKVVRLTTKGGKAQDEYRRLLALVEERWLKRFGETGIGSLRASLQDLIGQRDGDQPRLSTGLRPYPDGWRAHPPYLTQTKAVVRDPSAALPHYPMVLHRGGAHIAPIRDQDHGKPPQSASANPLDPAVPGATLRDPPDSSPRDV